MSEIVEPKASVRTPTESRRRISLIWVVPIVTVLIAAWLIWDTLSKRGPTITITFESGEGLRAGQSHVMYKDLDMGLITNIALSSDRSHVVVTAEMTRQADPLMTSGAQFWVVKPRFFAGNISGLETLLSGSYIELLPAAEPGTRQQRSFTGLEEPPVLQAHVPGRAFLLKADRIGSMSVGSPVFYRDLAVGEVLGWDLGELAQSVTIHAFVRAPFDQYVHDESQFWDASGISVKLGADGVKVQVESLKAVLLGGVAFDTPAISHAAAPSAENHTFALYANHDAAVNAGFERRVKCLAYFPGSVAGLSPGANVTFQGLRVGEVTDVELQYDPKSDTIQVPVHFEVQPERIAGIKLVEGRGPVANARMLVQRGMRAQLESANLITGQMQVALAFVPDAPPAELQIQGDTLIVPTVAGGFAGITNAVNQLLAKLNQMPFDQIGKDISSTLQGVNGLVNGPQLAQSLTALQGTLASAEQLVKQLDNGVAPAMKQLPGISTNLHDSLAQADKLLISLGSAYGDNSTFSRDLDRLMPQLSDLVRSLRTLSDLLTRHPEALVRGRTNQGAE
jgi:paraquat-inducible protein B